VSSTLSPVVIRFGRLGDTVLLQPVLRKLRLRYGSPCRLLSLGPWSSKLYADQPDVLQVISFSKQSGSLWFNPQRLRAAWALRDLRESPFYICEPDVRAQTKVTPMLKLAGIPAEHCTFIESMPMRSDEHWVDWLLRFGDETPMAFRATHSAEKVDVFAAPTFLASMAERDDLKAWLRLQGLQRKPLVLLQPANKRTMRWNGVRASEDDPKSWPTEHWAALAQAINRYLPGAQIVLCGSSAEAAYLRCIKAASSHAAITVAAGDLPLGRLRALLEIAHSMISVDTGPAHLAAATGCPLVVLFGACSPLTWAPRSATGSAVSVLGGLPTIRRVDELNLAQVLAAWRSVSENGARQDRIPQDIAESTTDARENSIRSTHSQIYDGGLS